MMSATPEKTAEKRSWQTIVAEQQASCLEAIPPAWRLGESFRKELGISASSGTNVFALDVPRRSGIMSEEEIHLTESFTATQLLKELSCGNVSSAKVTLAFCKRAAISQQTTFCLTETCFDKALERAAFLDEHLHRTGKPYGALHGLPISVKDTFNLKGLPSTIGYVSFLEKPLPMENSTLVELLLDAGAILYAKTNVPTTTLSSDTQNNIYGRTLNPYNTSLTAGGSSGGEGALIANRGSLLGVGTDIAGSIRIPALCNGIYGFKPTSDRIPYGKKAIPFLPGAPNITSCAGPLATSMEDLDLFFRTVLEAQPWKYDSTAHAVPYLGSLYDDSQVGPQKLTIGFFGEQDLFPLHPPVRRVMQDARVALERAGYTMKDLSIPGGGGLGDAFALEMEYLFLDPEQTTFKYIHESGETPVPSIARIVQMAPPGGFPSAFENVSALNVKREIFKEEWRKMLVHNGIDLILSPGSQCTAVPHDNPRLPWYTAIWNVLDYPAIIIPYSKSSASLDKEPMTITEPATGPDYEPITTDGMPCAVQLVMPTFMDEKLLKAAAVIDSILNEHRKE